LRLELERYRNRVYFFCEEKMDFKLSLGPFSLSLRERRYDTVSDAADAKPNPEGFQMYERSRQATRGITN